MTLFRSFLDIVFIDKRPGGDHQRSAKDPERSNYSHRKQLTARLDNSKPASKKLKDVQQISFFS
ncbi:hypothetical protein CW304_04180 [Bacillus sp. UFRGS-B20]|nr:hypothetical protein CW304_04180 [Bacillus sp. UFRGS-B20]